VALHCTRGRIETVIARPMCRRRFRVYGGDMISTDEAAGLAARPSWWRGWQVDLAVTLVVGVVAILGTHGAASGQPEREPLDTLAYVLLAAGPIALLARHRLPVGVYVFTFGATLAYVLIGYPLGPIWLALILAFVNVVLTGHRLIAVVGLALGYVAFLWLPALLGDERAPTVAEALGLAAWLLVLLLAAEFVRSRRQRAIEAVRIRQEEARTRATEERLRIARELHDALGHHLSLINVQAGVTLHLNEELPEQTRSALEAIRGASKEALGELRSVLDILRQTDEQAPRTPGPSLNRLDALVSQAEAAGLTIRTETVGEAQPLPFGVDTAAYRIVQEALTNVSRHSGTAAATIEIAYGERDLTVQVDDDGRGSVSDTQPGTGKGIQGMRERVAALGGQLEAGPRQGGGFRVRARFPLNGAG
jgi:signal transduction histidine kinase